MEPPPVLSAAAHLWSCTCPIVRMRARIHRVCSRDGAGRVKTRSAFSSLEDGLSAQAGSENLARILQTKARSLERPCPYANAVTSCGAAPERLKGREEHGARTQPMLHNTRWRRLVGRESLRTSILRFCAAAASVNSSSAPLRSLSFRRVSFRSVFGWANRISTFLRRRCGFLITIEGLLDAMPRAVYPRERCFRALARAAGGQGTAGNEKITVTHRGSYLNG